MKRFYGCVLIVAFAIAAPQAAFAATGARMAPCGEQSLHAVASRSHAYANPCVAKTHHVIVETNYYQNASRVGQSNLAAYPEVRVRYGVTSRLETFFDGPSEVARSGWMRGYYYMQPLGFGAKYEFARSAGVTYSLSAENRPPLQALANLNLIPLSDFHLSANWTGGGHRSYGADFGVLDFESARRHSHHRNSAIAAFSVTQPLNARTSLTAELGDQMHAYYNGGAQYSTILTLQRMFSSHVLFNLEAGTAFNASGDSKPHYWGFGLVVH